MVDLNCESRSGRIDHHKRTSLGPCAVMRVTHRSRKERVGARLGGLATPVVPALVLLALAAVIVSTRLQFAAHRDLARFILVGARFAHVEQLPSPRIPQHWRRRRWAVLPPLRGRPADLSTTAHGILLDSPLRRQRIGYSFLAWALARGDPAAVAGALVAVNMLGLALAGLFGGLLARELGRYPLWGLLPRVALAVAAAAGTSAIRDCDRVGVCTRIWRRSSSSSAGRGPLLPCTHPFQ